MREQRERVRLELLAETVRTSAMVNKKNRKNFRGSPSLENEGGSFQTAGGNSNKLDKKKKKENLKDMRGFGRSDSNPEGSKILKGSTSSNLEKSLKLNDRAKAAQKIRTQRVSDENQYNDSSDSSNSDLDESLGYESRRQTESSTFFEDDQVLNGQGSPRNVQTRGPASKGRQRAGGGHPSDLPPTPKAMQSKMIAIDEELISVCAPSMNSVVSLVKQMKLQSINEKREMDHVRIQEERQMKKEAQQESVRNQQMNQGRR